ncbi:DUF3772 domain-containing protein [Histidinibacterium lentulum]|uniref:Mechanosensitive ion channel family protein n=1 Tax=Histidinibacterium lentulum TaxID=2480588 RepID=A0A3N2QL37_9RHOB|nr:DUF3772 domain-containing protein [Histidinibacterium lentulum]ROT95908.1 mechanosensitive ion channel family protein [Histidinibacterium lentulum]
MIRARRALCGAAVLFLLLLLSGWSLPAAAQEAGETGEVAESGPEASPDAVAARAAAEIDPQIAAELEEFGRVATRAAEALDAGRASTAAFDGLRMTLADWRDRLGRLDGLGARRETLQGRLAALGPPPGEGETEPEPVAERRAALQAELAALAAPALLVQEARAEASGLIAEIDALIRDRQTAALTERGPLPLLPQNWGTLPDNLGRGAALLRAEVVSSVQSPVRLEAARQGLPGMSLMGLVGLALLLFGRRWVRAAEARALRRTRPGTGAVMTLLSLGHFALPLLGAGLVIGAVVGTGLAGPRIEALLGALLSGVWIVLAAAWLTGRLFRPDPGPKGLPVDLGEEARARLRRYALAIGWTMAAEVFLGAVVTQIELSERSAAVLTFPLTLALGLLLFGLGRNLARELRKDDESKPEDRSFRDRLLSLVGRLTMVAGVLGPLVAALGFDAGASFLQLAVARTLALLGALIILQRFVFEAWALLSGRPESETDALAPVLIAFVLSLAALPVLALIWGARVVDLTELWARFREGFTWGETTISPGQFLTFVMVFAAIYLLTRLVQGGLRSAVLPRTRLDIGGQNAIAAGVGYVGIFAAALIGIAAAGVNLTALGFVAGALSVGIGFGLQNVVSNFVSGIILLIERPISEGDWIEVGGQMGYVKSISVRATRIETFDRTDVIVPNADFVSAQVINWTRGNLVGRVIVPVGVAYGTDTEKVSAILLDIARQHPMVLMNPAPFVHFKGFGESSLDFEIRAILRDINFLIAVTTEMNHQIARRFAEEGIEIPFAQRDIWLKNPEVLRGDRSGEGAA